MSLRDLVTGSDTCTASDGAGPSNAVGALVNNLLGGTSKAQEQLRELPGVHQPGANGGPSYLSPEAAAMASFSNNMQVPGVGPSRMDGGRAQAFAASLAGPSVANPAEWDAIFAGPSGSKGPGFQVPLGPLPHQTLAPPGVGPGLLPPNAIPPAVQDQLRRFVGSAARSMGAPGAVMGTAPMLPPDMTAGLSVVDRCRIRDRSTILARHMFAEQGEAFADQQVGRLLDSLHIRPQELPSELSHVHDASWHEVWASGQQPGMHGPSHMAQSMAAELAANGSAAAQWDNIWNTQQRPALPHPASTGWAQEFQELQGPGGAAAAAGPEGWAQEFQQQQLPGGAWAEEFTSATATSDTQGAASSAAQADAQRSTQQLVDVLSRDADPKMRNSKFLQFVSKMSKGELILGDNKVIEVPGQASAWASEFSGIQEGEAAAQPGDARWADEFARSFAQGLDLGNEQQLEDAWNQQVSRAGQPADSWVQEFATAGDEETFKEWEQIYGQGHPEAALGAAASRDKREYVFAANNPFIGDEQAFVKGKDLFRRGVLGEAALALEAEVTSHPDNAEAWRLLGTVHAENDDDQQAIAAMLRAVTVNPRDIDVLLALGVSHVNELDTGEAIQHLVTWLSIHPKYSQQASSFGAPLDSSQALVHVIRMFSSIAASHPEDAEVAVALGVLHHLNRQYNEAIAAFETALKLRPQDYSLWNKLGATLANNARSSEAIHAYQKALDLKPNYMRAWTNMGISFANIGEYNKSARFYVRALSLNPSASHVWGYLRTSLACAGSLELMPAVDEQQLDRLAAALPLE